jgi:hypothetical protein
VVSVTDRTRLARPCDLQGVEARKGREMGGKTAGEVCSAWSTRHRDLELAYISPIYD